MKRTQTTYLLTIGALFLLALGAGGGWFLASWAASGVWWPLVLVGALIVVSGWLLHRFVHAYFFQLRELTEDAQTMLRVNPEHRAQATGTPDVRALAVTLNEFAAERSRVQADLSAQIADARTELTEERNLLAALMAELVSGVLVCNLDGQILLYNRSARTLLGQERGARRGRLCGAGPLGLRAGGPQQHHPRAAPAARWLGRDRCDRGSAHLHLRHHRRQRHAAARAWPRSWTGTMRWVASSSRCKT